MDYRHGKATASSILMVVFEGKCSEKSHSKVLWHICCISKVPDSVTGSSSLRSQTGMLLCHNQLHGPSLIQWVHDCSIHSLDATKKPFLSQGYSYSFLTASPHGTGNWDTQVQMFITNQQCVTSLFCVNLLLLCLSDMALLPKCLPTLP